MADALEFLQVDLFQAPDQLFRGGDGWARSAALLAELGDPQDAAPVVHVAGTAGKGTVAAGIAAAAARPGRRVGLHLSPHVYDLRERFSVDGRWCAPDEVADLLAAVLPAAARLADSRHGPPTYYEVTLAMALVHFVRQHCDLVVLETGIGGRYDGTNTVTRPDKLAVITRIDLDHEAVLGSTLEAIAAQKAGILTRGGEAVVLRHDVAAIDDSLAAVAADLGCRIHPVGPPSPEPGQVAHLVEDTALVQAAMAVLDARQGRSSDAAAVARAVGGLTLPGRFERVRTPEGAEAVLDGAHNPVKLAALIDRLRQELGDGGGAGWPWVFGCRRDKKAPAMLAMLAHVVDRHRGLVLVQFPIVAGDVAADVSTDPEELAVVARAAGIDRVVVADLDEAAGWVRAGAGREATVVAGSFHLLAALRPRLVGVSRARPRADA
jgi:dihydrofolate synthase / folylpolyglutamate synthase